MRRKTNSKKDDRKIVNEIINLYPKSVSDSHHSLTVPTEWLAMKSLVNTTLIHYSNVDPQRHRIATLYPKAARLL